ncbi:Tat binding protein 1-interacting protein-domain-containing protein [Xylogone sp. PMI_703]|nr:Tat binding protein 1-interacting protein-domain-containing protein [Xylogone sp. PMI_703]
MAPRAPKSTHASGSNESDTKEATITISSGSHKPEKITKSSSSSGSNGGTVTGDAASELILEYLSQQNRPYSATDISANLHNKVTKTNADKILKDLEKKGLIMGKATKGDAKGSQWVFWCLQDPTTSSTPADLTALDTTITTLRETIPLLKAQQKDLNARLQTLRSAPTTSELRALVETLRSQRQEKTTRLAALKNGSVEKVSKEEMERIGREWKFWDRAARIRRKCFLELEDTLVEAGMGREELWEKAGVEDVE